MMMSSRFDEQIFLKIKDDDPSVTRVDMNWGVDDFASGIDWERDGEFISNNTHLRALTVSGYRHDSSGRTTVSLCNFLKFVSRNKSINDITFIGWIVDGGSDPCPFSQFELSESIRHFDMCELKFENDEEKKNIVALASALERCEDSSLESIYLGGFPDDCLGLLINALMSHQNLGKIDLGGRVRQQYSEDESGRTVMTDALYALGNVLGSPGSKVREICIDETAGMRGPCAAYLAEALSKSTHLEALHLHDCNFDLAGWKAWANCFRCLKSLKLTGSFIRTEAVAILSGAIANCTHLKTLDLTDNRYSRSGDWESFQAVLRNPPFSLEKLRIRNNKGVSGCDLVGMLSKNTSLKHLDISAIAGIDATGWRTVVAALQNPTFALENLNLEENNNIDEDTLLALADTTSLKVLNLSQINSGRRPGRGHGLFAAPARTVRISRSGWQNFATAILRLNSSIEELDISDCFSANVATESFANAMAGNKTLKELCLNSALVNGAENAISQMMCNTSSISKTFLSNHTICSFGWTTSAPRAVQAYLHLNGHGDKKQVAKMKILRHHPHLDMEPLLEWELKVMPNIVAWFDAARAGIENMEPELRNQWSEFVQPGGLDARKLSSIYQFVRFAPLECVPAKYQRNTKRKRAEELAKHVNEE